VNVEVLAIGTELLLGHIVNTNASEIGERLALAGLDHRHQSVVGDNFDRVVDAIQRAVNRSDALVITGGIGPTQDDITREALAAAAGVEMLMSEEYADQLRSWWAKRGRPMPSTNLRQAEYPAGATFIANPKGSAPGLRMELDGTLVYALPGVPQEMLPMIEAAVIPDLVAASGSGGAVIESVVLRTHGESESKIAEILGDLFDAHENPTMAFLASAGEIKVRLTARASDEAAAKDLIAPLEREVRDRLGSLVFATGLEPVQSMVLDAADQRGWTVGTIESATGGMVAASLTSIPGASEVFRGSIVAYATDLKTGLAGVDAGLVEREGVVSEAVALAMAEQGAVALGVDVCVAVTGSAGPEAQERTVGTMIVAVHTPEATVAKTMQLPGDRERIRAYTTTAALHLVRRAVSGEWWD
jgi:nicotinamide-nucleotide amidase